MSFLDVLDRDIQLIMQDIQGVAEDVVFICSSTGLEYPLRAIFSNAPSDITAGEMKNTYLANSPLVTLHVNDIQKHIKRRIIEKDGIHVRGIHYLCQSPRYNSFGMVTIKLAEKTISVFERA